MRRSTPLRACVALAAFVIAITGGMTTSKSVVHAGEGAPTPPFNECPAIGQDTGCGLLIVVNQDGTTTVISDPSQPPFDGTEDTLVGVLNNGPLLHILPLSSSSSTPIFDFDGDGICGGGYSPGPTGCPYGPNGYEGPDNTFTVITPNSGTVNFPNGLDRGGATYFSLEGAATAGNIVVPRYVALGDSYSAGEGTPPFDPTTDTSQDECHRSLYAYPEVLHSDEVASSNPLDPLPATPEFWACSGAQMKDFYQREWPPELPQLHHIDCLKDQNGNYIDRTCTTNHPPATLITLSVGGNDIGFEKIAKTCADVQVAFGLLGHNDNYQPNCGAVLGQEVEASINGLTTGDQEKGVSYSLRQLYGDIRDRASLARVFVVGYPSSVPSSGSGDCTAEVFRENGSPIGVDPVQGILTLHSGDITWINNVISRLNATIELNALDAGFYFVDNAHTFDGHDVCSSDPYSNGVVLHNNDNDPSSWSFHPNLAGQRYLANQLESVMADVDRSPVTIFPQQTIQQSITVIGGLLQFVAHIAWPGSDVQLRLMSPSGKVYDRTTQVPGVIHQLQSNAETFAIPHPEPGQWTLQLYGANVAASGEPVNISTTQIPLANFAPVAAIGPSTDRGVAPLTVQFSGQGSSAYNGASITSYHWDFGDGTPSASGSSVTHVFTAPGTHTVTLTVTDSNGQSNSATQEVFVSAIDQAPTASFIWGSLDPSTPAQASFDASASTDVDGQVVKYSWDFGDGSTGSGVTPVHTYATDGTYPVTLTVTDNGGLIASICQSVTTGKFSSGPPQSCRIPTKLVYTGPSTGDFNDPTAVSATLTTATDGRPVPNVTLGFGLSSGGGTCTAVTNASGVASCTLTPSLAAGTSSISVTFAQTAQYSSTQTSAPFTVTAEESTLTLAAPSAAAQGAQVSLSGKLLEDGSTRVSGRTLTFSLGSGDAMRTCTATTTADGSATCSVTASQDLGPTTATVSFAGDSYYRPAHQAASTVIFGWPSQGFFVVGDQSATGTVTFWGAQWSGTNRLNGGPAPSSFKGFANTTATPSCGSTWTASPGNSSGDPSSIPAYMAVAVASSVAKSGSTISGNASHIVIVKVNPGYAPDPGHPGTGTVVATLC